MPTGSGIVQTPAGWHLFLEVVCCKIGSWNSYIAEGNISYSRKRKLMEMQTTGEIPNRNLLFHQAVPSNLQLDK